MLKKNEIIERLTLMGVTFDKDAHHFTLGKLLREAEANLAEQSKFTSSEPTTATPNNEMFELPRFVTPESSEPAQPVIAEVDGVPVVVPADETIQEPNATVLAMRANVAEVQSKLKTEWMNKKTLKIQQVHRMVTKPDAIEVRKNNGEYIRTYSKEIHGATYAQLAQQYCDKRNGELKEKSV